MLSKKEKKIAKKNGGISAAVHKQQAAAKLSKGSGDGDGNKIHDGSSATSNKSLTPSEASSPPANTPEIKAVFVDNGSHVAESPLLDDALSTISASPNTAPSLTNEWAKTVMAGSPNNLINLTSESPPTQPSSYEDAAKMHNGWAAGHRPFALSPSPTSLSPPSSNQRPLSFQSDTHYHIAGTSPRSTGAANRRSSLYSHFSTSQQASPHYPPLPHQPQSHFYGVRDLDLDLPTTAQSGVKAGDQGYYFGFDRLPSDNGPSAKAEKVVMAGYQGGLKVYAVGRKGIELVGSLKGLRGGVYHAKILPWTLKSQSPDSFPLVAVVVHGPVLPSRTTDGGSGRHNVASPDATPADSSATSRPSHAHSEAYSTRTLPPIQFYQTSVEIYSIKTNKLVDVLLQTPSQAINTEVSLSSPLFQPPSPSGAFSIKADAGTVAICSGLTGECWIYRQLLEPQNTHMFACAGKVWTTIQQSYRAEVLEEADKINTFSTSSRPASHHRSTPQMPIFSLNGRWIAYCPSKPSSQAALRAHIPVPTQGRAPGVSSMAPPHLPASSVAVDLPISDSMMNKFMRETTQELISGMKWVGQQGLQAWNSYWSQSLTSPTQQQQQQQARSPPSHWNTASSSSSRAPSTLDPTSQFPPTHGTSGCIPPTTAKDPGLVSIVDVEMLPVSTTVHPLATFATPLGCSFVSFSPSSLALFTASSKGDVQTVWDLFRLQHTSSSPLQTTLTQYETIGPQVRQIAQFSRMTVARIVDVAWSEPHGDRLAMVTERGTIHLLDMPFSSFMWPPPRRRKVANSFGSEAAEQPSSAVSIASGALGAAYQAAKPFVSRSRRGSSNNTNHTTTITPVSAGTTLRDSAAQGGRVIAASISHSLGKTGTAISQLRHTGENRLSLPPSMVVPSISCVSWYRGKKSQSLFAIGGGMVRAFLCRKRPSTSTFITTTTSTTTKLTASSSSSSVVPGKQSSRANKYKDFQVPLLPDDTVAPIVRQIMELGAAEEYLELSEADMEAENTLTLKPPRSGTEPTRFVLDATIPQAEIESSAPYQPFHTDRRVTLCEYGREDFASVLLSNTSIEEDKSLPSNKKKTKKTKSKSKYKNTRHVSGSALSGERAPSAAWAFGQPISSVQLDLGSFLNEDEFVGPDDHMALPQSAMERVMQYGDAEQIVVTTRRRRGGRQGDVDEDGFFEDDCEVLDFADQRV